MPGRHIGVLHDTNPFTSLSKVYLLEGRTTPVILPVRLPGFFTGFWKDYIEQQENADIVLFHSTLKGFYEQAGFERIESLITLVGDPHSPQRSDETAFMLFLSEKGKRARHSFENEPVYIGESIW